MDASALFYPWSDIQGRHEAAVCSINPTSLFPFQQGSCSLSISLSLCVCVWLSEWVIDCWREVSFSTKPNPHCLPIFQGKALLLQMQTPRYSKIPRLPFHIQPCPPPTIKERRDLCWTMRGMNGLYVPNNTRMTLLTKISEIKDQQIYISIYCLCDESEHREFGELSDQPVSYSNRSLLLNNVWRISYLG